MPPMTITLASLNVTVEYFPRARFMSALRVQASAARSGCDLTAVVWATVPSLSSAAVQADVAAMNGTRRAVRNGCRFMVGSRLAGCAAPREHGVCQQETCDAHGRRLVSPVWAARDSTRRVPPSPT